MKNFNIKNLIGVLLCIVIFFILAILKGLFDSQFRNYCHEIQLQDVVCFVPESMWIRGKDDASIGDYDFIIQDDNFHYVICGVQLEKIDQISGSGLYDIFDSHSLKKYEDIDELIELLQYNGNVLNTITSSRTIDFSDESIYLIDGEGGGQYEDYKTFIVAKKKGDIRFLEVLLYRSPTILHSYERKEMYRKLKVL